MAGTNVDMSGYKTGQPYNGTTSATVNEVDVITPPTWARKVGYYCENASRSGHPASGAKTTADTLTDSDPHKTLPATSVLEEDHNGSTPLYISCSTASSGYQITFYD